MSNWTTVGIVIVVLGILVLFASAVVVYTAKLEASCATTSSADCAQAAKKTTIGHIIGAVGVRVITLGAVVLAIKSARCDSQTTVEGGMSFGKRIKSIFSRKPEADSLLPTAAPVPKVRAYPKGCAPDFPILGTMEDGTQGLCLSEDRRREMMRYW